MWKTFTDRRGVAPLEPALAGRLTVLVCGALLQGCAASGGAPTAASDDPALSYLDPAIGEAPMGKPLPPAPEVQGRNAETFARATELLQAGRLIEAEALLLEITDDQPELAGPWINLAQVFVAQGRDDDAVAALEQAVLANPGNCAGRTELGVLLRKRGEFAAAESHYLACLEYQPGYQAAYLNLGILYDLYLGRPADALAAYRHYQDLAGEEDRRVSGWVMDLERRAGS